MFSFKVPIKRSNKLSFGMFFTLRLAFGIVECALCNWTFLPKIYQLTKECVSLNIPIMCYQFIRKNGPRDNRVIFFIHKSIGTKQIDQVLNTKLQELPFVKLALGVDQIIAPSRISML
jgi:hypothetical protein